MSNSVNRLDGMSILRFAHALSGGAGMEQYIDDLDKTILKRNEVSIIYIYFSESISHAIKSVEKIGRGTLIRIPLYVERSVRHINADMYKMDNSLKMLLKTFLRDWVLYNPLLYRILFREIIKKRSPPRQGIVAQDTKKIVQITFQEHKIDIVIMHHLGGTDSDIVIGEAQKRKIPYITLNHFSNDQFNHMSIREQIVGAAGVAGVSSIGIPRRLRKRFVNLSDGIDTEMLRPEAACPVNFDLDLPVVFLPARIVRTKGQHDLIEASAVLKNEGLRVKVVLAGRKDSEQYEEQLKKKIRLYRMVDDILFVGQLNKEELRDWYGVASVVAVPTYQEGLGRVLLEAQAMEVPVLAYDVGGVSEALENNKTGYLIKKGSIRGLTAKLKKILLDHDKRNEMGKAGRRFIKRKYSLEAFAQRHEKYYLDAISSNSINSL